jgi:hypothetical protein
VYGLLVALHITYDQVLEPSYGSIWQSHIEPAVETVTVQDPSTVQIKLKHRI